MGKWSLLFVVIGAMWKWSLLFVAIGVIVLVIALVLKKRS